MLLPFDLAGLRSAFILCANQFPNMQPATKAAHNILFNESFLLSNSVKITKIFGAIIENHSELAMESLHGKVNTKLSGLRYSYPQGFSNFQRAETDHTLAALLIELHLDNGVFACRTETQRVEGKYTQRTIVELGGIDQPVDLLAGYCDGPGQLQATHIGHERIPATQKALYLRMSQMKFKVSDVFSEALLKHFYKLSPEYNGESASEGRTSRKFRHNVTYMNAAKELAAKPHFHMPVYPDDRGREYYRASRLFGLRPQGKLAETLLLDRAEPVVLGESAISHMKHIIFTLRYGKVSVADAVNGFSGCDLAWARGLDPLSVEVPDVKYSKATQRQYREAEGLFGEYLLANKAAKALENAEAGIPCHYLFGKDLANSGLIMAANCFRSEKMLHGANMMGEDAVADSHVQFGKAHGVDHLPRGEIKDIHTPLLHGSSAQTLLRILQSHVSNPEDFDLQKVLDHNVDAYGKEVNNIDAIAQWGHDVVSNNQNILKWKMPDGFPACHKAVMVRTPFSVYAASTRVKNKAYKEYKVMATMPLSRDRKGFPVFGRENTSGNSNKGVEVKTRGLYANVTHSIDAMLLRWVSAYLLERDEVFLVKHDDYIMSPDCFEGVIKVCQEFFRYLQNNNVYQDALDQIAERSLVCNEAPVLLVGSGPDRTAESFNFLMV